MPLCLPHGHRNGFVLFHGAGPDSFRGCHESHETPQNDQTPFGVARPPFGVAMTPIGVAMTLCGVAMTPLGVAMTLFRVARKRIGNDSLRIHSGTCQGPWT